MITMRETIWLTNQNDTLQQLSLAASTGSLRLGKGNWEAVAAFIQNQSINLNKN